MLYLAVLVVVSIILMVLYHHFNRNTRLMNKIPGPKAWPIIGNSYKLFLSPENIFTYQRSLVKKYGDVNQIYGMNIRMVNISNPKAVEKILSSSEYNYKEHPYTYFSQWLGAGLLLSNGNKWYQRRKILTKAFHFNILKKFMATFVDQTEYFLKEVQKEVGKEQTSLQHLVSSTMLRIMCETSMGATFDGLKSEMVPYFKSIHSVGECVTKRFARPWLHFENIYQLTDIAKEQNIAIENLHKFTNTIINQRRAYLTENLNQFDEDGEGYGNDKKLAMLDLLLKNEKDGVIDIDGIREEVDTFMFEGHDTTTVAVTYLILALANEPEVQDKLFYEIHKIFGDSDRSPSIEDLNEMKYLDCCIKESLRLYPSVPIIVRYLTTETVLGGYTVPANTSCFIFIYDLLRRADVFPDPERFIPERFLPENYVQRNPYAYIPFSAGPRNCIGQKFALLEIKTVVSGLLRKFRLLPVTRPYDLIYKSEMVLRTTHPVYVKFCLRKSE